MRKLILFIPFVFLSGCAQYQMQQRETQRQEALFAIKTVCANDAAKPVLNPVRDQIPFDARNATVAQLADPHFPNEIQKNVIENIDKYFATCREYELDYINTYAAATAPIFDESHQKIKSLRAQLWAGKITFGQFNTERARITSMTTRTVDSMQRSDRIQAQQLEMERQRTNAAILQSLPRPQPYYLPPIPINRPITTNCHRYGQTINCTTQ